MKYLSIFTLIHLWILACETVYSGDLSIYITTTNSIQNVDRARALLNSQGQNSEYNSFLDMIDIQPVGGIGTKAKDSIYNSSGGYARIDKHIGDSSIMGVSIGGVYTEIAGNTPKSQDLAIMTNLYAATKSDSLPLGAFVDFGYANFLGDSTTFGTNAMTALAGITLNFETNMQGLSYSPLLMLNSLYFQDTTNPDTSSYNALKMIAGIEFDYTINKKHTATLKGLYAYEFKDTTNAYNYNNFTGNYAYLGEVGKGFLEFGAGLNYNFNDTISAGFDYSIYLYNTFISNNLSLKIDLSF